MKTTAATVFAPLWALGLFACSSAPGTPGDPAPAAGCTEVASLPAADKDLALRTTRRTDEEQPGSEMPTAASPCVVRVTAETTTHPSKVTVPDLK